MQHALTRAQPELDADGLAVWQQLGRLAGPGERQAAALALLLWPGNDAERRAWIESFLARHPCHCDDMKPAILDHLTERSRR